jgi:excisionase family DNA binding protein
VKLYTTSELATYLRVSEAYVLKMRQSGKLPHYKISSRGYRYDVEEVKRALRRASPRFAK